MNGYADLGTLWLNVGVKNKVNDEFKQIENTVSKSAKKVEDLGKKFTKYLTLPLAGLGTLAIKEFADFESAMSKVQATTSATGNEMALLNAKARDLGKSTIYSAEEVAQAMNYMAMAGWDTTQIIDGLDGVLSLATASGEDLATVSDIVTDALTAFGLGASDTQDFVDLLANTARSANTNVSMLGESFKYVAPVSASLGISAEQTALALGLLANSGIKGSQAGTTLRAALNQLIKPSKEAAGLMKEYGIAIQTADDGSVDLMGTVGSLKNGISHLEKTQQAQVVSTLVGTEAMSGMLAMMNATEADVTKLTKATTDYKGSAQEMADTMNNNVKGNLNKLKSAFSELLIVVGENIVPMFTTLVEKATEVVEWFSSMDEGTQEFIVQMGLLGLAIGPVLSVVGKLMSVGSGLSGMFGGVATTVSGSFIPALTGSGGLVSAFGSLNVALGLLGGGAAIGIAGFIALNHHAKETAVLSFEDTLKNIDGISDTTAQMVVDVKTKWEELAEANVDYFTNIDGITEEGTKALVEKTIQHGEEVVGLLQTDYEERQALMVGLYDNLNGEQQRRLEEAYFADEQSGLDKIEHAKTLNEQLLEQQKLLTSDDLNVRDQATKRIVELTEELAGLEIQSRVDLGSEMMELMKNQDALEESERAEMASKMIKNANDVRDGKILAANEAYEKESEAFSKIEGISAVARHNLIKDAETRKDEAIKSANLEKAGVVGKLGEIYPEVSSIVDYNTGEINNNWLQMWKRVTSDHDQEMNKMLFDLELSARDYSTAQEDMGKSATDNFGKVEVSSGKSLDSVVRLKTGMETSNNDIDKSFNGPISQAVKFKEKIDAIPSSKKTTIITEEIHRVRTEVFGSTSGGRSATFTNTFANDGLVSFNDALYNMTAFNTGFNPRDEITKYEVNNSDKQQVQTISTKGIEERLEKLAKLFEEFKDLKVYLDKYTLVGELTPGISKQLMKGVRPR